MKKMTFLARKWHAIVYTYTNKIVILSRGSGHVMLPGAEHSTKLIETNFLKRAKIQTLFIL